MCAATLLSTGSETRTATARVAPGQSAGSAAATPPTSGVGDEWIVATGDYANTRFSTLTEITTQNVGNLKLAWTFKTGFDNGHEAAPIVVGNTMYIVAPYPNHLFAIDLTSRAPP